MELREWYWNIALALPATALVAMASWRFVEKPAHDLRAKYKRPATPEAEGGPFPWRTATLLIFCAFYALFLSRQAVMPPLLPLTHYLVLTTVIAALLVVYAMYQAREEARVRAQRRYVEPQKSTPRARTFG